MEAVDEAGRGQGTLRAALLSCHARRAWLKLEGTAEQVPRAITGPFTRDSQGPQEAGLAVLQRGHPQANGGDWVALRLRQASPSAPSQACTHPPSSDGSFPCPLLFSGWHVTNQDCQELMTWATKTYQRPPRTLQPSNSPGEVVAASWLLPHPDVSRQILEKTPDMKDITRPSVLPRGWD